jgi:hypothetical protein
MEPQRPRPSAVEVRKQYSIRSAIIFPFLIWFIRDGWFNDDPKMQEHLMFNRIGSVVLAGALLFCLVMAGSAALAIRRQRQQPSPPGAV